MTKRTTVEFEGQMVPADELEFEQEKEPWSVYRLEDGTLLKAKQMLVNIYKLVDRYKPDGEPIYSFKMAGMVTVDVPAGLKKKTD